MFFRIVRHPERRLLAVLVSLTLVLSLGLTACRTASGGLGRLDVPKQRAAKVKKVGLGARKVRQQVAKEKKANDQQVKRAKAERKASWPKPGKASVHLDAKNAGKASPAKVPVNVHAAARAAGKTG